MVYSNNFGPRALNTVKAMVNAFTKKHMLKTPLPIIRLDTNVDVRSSKATPWVFDPQDQIEDSLIV